jgi:hypothetical protein
MNIDQVNIDQVNIAWKQIPVSTKMACGAREPRCSSDGKLCFRVESKPMRFVEVSLDADDTYTVEYLRVKRGSYDRVSIEKASGVYVENLGETIYHQVNK